MTPDERELLHAIAWIMKTQMRMATIGQVMDQDAALVLLDQKTEAVRAKPSALTPRPKYVRIEKAPADTRFNCQSCGDDGDWLVRIGEYYDPSALLCPTCIREAAALLDTST